MPFAAGWGSEQQKHLEDSLRESNREILRLSKVRRRKEKIKKILDGNKHSR